jgi:hypothetical protein
MGRRLKLRAVTDEERQAVKRLARSRTAPARAVLAGAGGPGGARGADGRRHRARPAPVAHHGVSVAAPLRGARSGGGEDRSRTGRPRTSPGEQVGEIVATALSAPRMLGLPFASWTRDDARPLGGVSERAPRHHQASPGITMKRRSAAAATKRCATKRCSAWDGAGASRSSGVASGWSRRVLRTGGDRAALPRSPSRQRRRLSRRDGSGGGKELRGPSPHPTERPSGRAPVRPSAARRRSTTGGVAVALSSAQCLRRMCAGDGERPHLDGPASYHRQPPPTTANVVAFLDQVETWIDPAVERVDAILDHVSAHRATAGLFFALAHPRWEVGFQPTDEA